MKRQILARMDRDSVAMNLAHMAAQAAVCAASSRLRFTPLNQSGWERRSDTLVVLAGGRSAAAVTGPQWRELEQYDILALSYGGLLPVRYDLLVSEFAPPVQQPNQAALFRWISRRFAGTADKPFCLWKHPERTTCLEHLELPVVRVPTIIIPARSLATLRRMTDLVVRRGWNRRAMFQSAGSLSAILMAARTLGYGRTVLIGVDLTDRHYFFDDNPDYASAGLVNPFRLEGETDLDRTHQVATGFGDVADFAQRLEIAAGPSMQLMVGSAESALARFWPVYSFGRGQVGAHPDHAEVS